MATGMGPKCLTSKLLHQGKCCFVLGSEDWNIVMIWGSLGFATLTCHRICCLLISAKTWDEGKMWNIHCMVSELFPTVTGLDVLGGAVSGVICAATKKE